MPRKLERPHRAALTRMFRATGAVNRPELAPLVELMRMLADEIDAGAGSRARATYMSTLREFRHSMEQFESSRPPVATVAPGSESAPRVNVLEEFRKRRLNVR